MATQPGESDAPRWREALEAHQRLDDARHEAAEKAVGIAYTALEKRLDAMNEFRLQLADQTRSYMPRPETEALMNGIEAKYQALATALGTKYDALASRMDIEKGRSSGLNAGWGYLVGFVGLVGGLLAIVYAITK